MKILRETPGSRQSESKKKKGSVLVATLLAMLVMSFIILFSLRAANQDTYAAYRRIQALQARYMAEGALARAKGDVITQIASTNFLSDTTTSVQDRYQNVTARFDVNGRRIPATTPNNSLNWKSPATTSLAFWDFKSGQSVEGKDLNITANDDWRVPGQNQLGEVRAYITQSSVTGTQNVIQGFAGNYNISISAVAEVGNAQSIITSSFQHRLGRPQLFNFLMLGASISDCSICHVKLWGDIGQVNPEDPIQTEFDYNQWSGGLRTSIYGSIYTNGDVYRDSFSGSDPFEDHLWRAGRDGTFDGWDINKRMRIFSRNGEALRNEWRNDNGTASENENPYVAIDPNTSPLPDQWPSVKENLMAWFEPRATAKAIDGTSELRVDPRDNNLQYTYRDTVNGTTKEIGGGATNAQEYYKYAIDRVFPRNTAFTSGGANRDTGLHPFDDLDGDTIPNAFDANIDDHIDTAIDSYPETKRGSNDPASLAYKVTDPALASYFTTDPVTGRTIFTLGRPAPTAGNAWNTSDNNLNLSTLHTFVQNNPNTLSDVYRRSGTNYYWNADLSGIATSMSNLVNNNFASTPGNSPGKISGVFPNNSVDSEGNPIYGDVSERNLIIRGSDKNPINTRGSVVIRGDAVVTGTVKSHTTAAGTKSHGQIIAHRNIFIPTDLKYSEQPDWDDPSIDEGDQLGLLSGGNVMIGNYIQLSDWRGGKSGKADPNREGNSGDPDRYFNGIMAFVWGNMVDPNDENLFNWYWGRDGSSSKKFNHMLNPTYLMDGEEGGYWDNGIWVTENAGNTVADRFKGNNERIQIGGGLDTSADSFNEDRKHQNYYGNTNSGSNRDNSSYYKNFYISTPGLLPLGSNRIPYLPSGAYGTYDNPWFNSEDLKVLTQIPKFGGDISSGQFNGTLGAETNDDSRWIKTVQSILYSDNGVIGGSILRGSGKNASNKQALQFYGAVVGRDIQLVVAGVNGDREEKYNNTVGALYYDQRLRQSPNPLDFPFSEGFEGGEMSMNGIPPIVNGSRDEWRPFRVSDEYFTIFDDN